MCPTTIGLYEKKIVQGILVCKITFFHKNTSSEHKKAGGAGQAGGAIQAGGAGRAGQAGKPTKLAGKVNRSAHLNYQYFCIGH